MPSSFIASLTHNAAALVAALSQTQTNGGCLLGTHNAPNPPPFLTNNPIANGYPWGTLSASNTNPYTNSPNTGVVRSYDFTIERGTIAPDGFERSVILINGQFPGPTIEANWGDTIQVTTHNNIANPAEGTALHWHGFLQQGSEWEDGVPAVSQCPIPPGGSFTYSFKASLYGSSWYHSHYSAQYAGGLWGPLIVHGPQHVPYDVDLGPIALSDWYHEDYFTVLAGIMGTDPRLFRPASDNNLINGKMNFDCSGVDNGTCTNNAGLSTFKFTSGKRIRLRLINSSAAAIQKFSIDNHTMTVIANDFVPIEPYNTTVVTLAVGQRTDVIVTANGKPTDAVWMRSTIASGECTYPANQPYAVATVYYENANNSASPRSIAHADTTNACQNDDLSETVPFYSIAAGSPATTIDISISFGFNATGHFLWYMNNSTYRGNYNDPLFLLAAAGKLSYPYDPEWNIYNVGSNSSIRLYVENTTPASHPMHLHGHNMFILAEGTGTWDGSTIINGNNPQRRDVQIVQGNGYAVFQWNSDNPGVWPFHCHIAWHISGGMQVSIMERPDDIRRLPVTSTSYQLCSDWDAYTKSAIVDQIDSGV
ncbi:multicopper like protein [Lasallia pustulata]|uniref:Multicopper like protein n=1 Tax=Lasallia pustulata TaxID=136370 RepID=A0A1W5CVX3_9LECA|nr:multicopper like protein [Lasallia pustulata]